MDLSVVVPTLNGRDRLAACLDALAVHAPEAEVIVANGPSADGTTGMVRDRDDVDVLVEISDRTVNVARNAGIEVATGDAVAVVDYDHRIGTSWVDGIQSGLDEADVVTGPVTPAKAGASTTDTPAIESDAADAAEPADGPEQRTIAGRDVTYFETGNVAFRSETLRDLDGFDEYLHTGGARDAAHRLARMDCDVAWCEDVRALRRLPNPTAADGGRTAREWGLKYRALSYRLCKNYGVRPTVIARAGSHALTDALSVAREVVRGESTPSQWVATGRDVLVGLTGGGSDGLVTRRSDRSPTRNPNGISTRANRAVARYDSRDADDG